MIEPNDPLDDPAIDRLIQATLDVEPSADFPTRVRTAIAESTIDQQIQADLNQEPSAGFVARVRQRIEADEPSGVESGFGRIVVGSGFPGLSGVDGRRIVRWQWLGAGVLATAAVLAFLMVRPANDAVTLAPRSTQARSDIALPAPLPVPSPAPTAPPSVSPQDVVRPVTSRTRVVAQAQPEMEPVPVATRSEIEGLRQLVAAARSGLIDDSLAALPTLDSEQPLAVVPPLSIASLSVDALDH